MNFKKLAVAMSRSPHVREAHTNVWVNVYTIHEHPAELPNKYVVRLWCLHMSQGAIFPSPQMDVHEELAHARQELRKRAPSAERFGRTATDDPEIVETWVDWCLPPTSSVIAPSGSRI